MKEIGELLRNTRLEKGLSLKDIQMETKIRQKYLEALEQGDFKVIPGEVYLKGFLRCYASALGLDGLELVERYKALQAGEPKPVETREEVLLRAPVTALSGTLTRDKRSRWPSAVAGFLLVVAVIAGGLYGVAKRTPVTPGANTSNMTGQRSPPPGGPSPVRPDTSTAPQADSPAPVEPPPAVPSFKVEKDETSPYQTRFTVKGADRLSLLARFTDRCWVQVTADGRVIFEGIPPVGQQFTWEAARELVIWAGYPSGLDLTLQVGPDGSGGVALGKVGGPANPKRLFFRLQNP